MTIEDQTAPKDERCCSCGSRIICHGCDHDPHVGECQQATGDATGDYGPCGCTRPRPSSPSLDEIAKRDAYAALDALIEAESKLPDLESVPEQATVFHGNDRTFIWRTSTLPELRSVLIAVRNAIGAKS